MMEKNKTMSKKINIIYNNVPHELRTTLYTEDMHIAVYTPSDSPLIIDIINKSLEEAYNVIIEKGSISPIRCSHKELDWKYCYVCHCKV